MPKKSNVLTIRVPEDLKDRIEKAAEKQGVSINQFALYAFTREISELEMASFFRDFYSGSSRKKIYSDFDAVMKKIGKKAVEDWDRTE